MSIVGKKRVKPEVVLLLPRGKLAESGELQAFFDRVQKQCGFPCVVKPNRGSGCVGVTKVNSRKEIKEAVDLAFKQDSQVVIEPAVTDGIEVTCTVHDMTTDELLEAFPVTEITPQGDEVFHSSELSK